MKDQNKKKLAQYSALAGAVLGTGVAQGQINYVDVVDTKVDTHNGKFDIDLDSDGSPDFVIRQYLDTGATGMMDAILITPYDSLYGRVSGELENNFSYPFKLAGGDSLKLDTEWAGNTATQSGYLVTQFNGTPYPNSYWKGPVTDGYLGLRIIKADGFHFGWVRLDIGADNRSFTVKDFAYNTVYEEGMVAGEPNLSTVERMLEELEIRYTTEGVVLHKPASYGEVEVRLLDASGREFSAFTWSEMDHELELSNQPNGMFLVEFTHDGIRNVRKVLQAQ